MAKNREDLQDVLEQLLRSRNVYFQPPASVKMKYPAIVYTLSNIQNTFADNSPYVQSNAYQLTVIDTDPDSEIVKRISSLPLCRFNRHFTSDNLYHDVFTLFY